MLLKDKRKGLATIIIKRIGKPSMDSGYKEEMSQHKPEGEVDNDMAKSACCDGIINAIESKDSKALKRHLLQFLEMAKEHDDPMHKED
jgi:predicted transcriptional regulator